MNAPTRPGMVGASRVRTPADLARAASRSLSTAPNPQRTPASIQLEEALRSVRKRGRFPVAPVDQRTLDGIVFASKLEAERYAHLKLRERLGEIRDIECQPFWKVEIAGEPFCKYTADFSYVICSNGYVEIEEVKSRGGTNKDAAYRLRRRAAELFHNIKIAEVF